MSLRRPSKIIIIIAVVIIIIIIIIKALANIIILRQINNYNMHTSTKRQQDCTKIFSVTWYTDFTKAFFAFKTS